MNNEVRILLDTIPGSDQDYGILDEDIHDKLDVLETIIMKRGTLANDEIDWAKTHTLCTQVLEKVSHMLAFRCLIISLCETQQEKNVIDAFVIAECLYTQHFPNMHPIGNSNKRRRVAWSNELLSLLQATLEKTFKTQGLSGPIQKAVEKFTTSCETSGIDAHGISKLLSEAEINSAAEVEKLQLRTDQTSFGAEKKELDAAGRAQLRRELKSMADRITGHDPDAAPPYLMRGYAGWLEFSELPSTNDAGRVEQQSMPSFIVDEHLSALEAPSIKTFIRLEDRLYLSPDWFGGQLIAFEMAQRLELFTAAEAIRQRTKGRLDLLPGLKTLSYADGATYVPKDIERWLSGTSKNTKLEQIDEKVDDPLPDFNSLWKHFDERIAAARSPRETALVKQDIARQLKAEGLLAHSRMLCSEIIALMKMMPSDEWDSALLQDLQREIST